MQPGDVLMLVVGLIHQGKYMVFLGLWLSVHGLGEGIWG